jgi:RND superfamily putative drug exporter
VRGISETGMVITFAAAIMILVFGSFAATDFLPAKMLGFTLATAVFFDATIVRILMSPALMRLAGRWNWWPGM